VAFMKNCLDELLRANVICLCLEASNLVSTCLPLGKTLGLPVPNRLDDAYESRPNASGVRLQVACVCSWGSGSNGAGTALERSVW